MDPTIRAILLLFAHTLEHLGAEVRRMVEGTSVVGTLGNVKDDEESTVGLFTPSTNTSITIPGQLAGCRSCNKPTFPGQGACLAHLRRHEKQRLNLDPSYPQNTKSPS
jgi:hypothetical protein